MSDNIGNTCKIICEANCKYKGSTGFYGFCKHPEYANHPRIGGADRVYTNGKNCELREEVKDT